MINEGTADSGVLQIPLRSLPGAESRHLDLKILYSGYTAPGYGV